jgi:hypothetical protein
MTLRALFVDAAMLKLVLEAFGAYGGVGGSADSGCPDSDRTIAPRGSILSLAAFSLTGVSAALLFALRALRVRLSGSTITVNVLLLPAFLVVSAPGLRCSDLDLSLAMAEVGDRRGCKVEGLLLLTESDMDGFVTKESPAADVSEGARALTPFVCGVSIFGIEPNIFPRPSFSTERPLRWWRLCFDD